MINKLTIIFLCFCLLFTYGVYSQKLDTYLITVKANIIIRDTSFLKHDYYNYYTVLTVTNNHDTAISFWITNHSWERYNWKTNNDSIFFYGNGNDIVEEEKITLLPHKSILFYGCILAKTKFVNSYFKIGFLCFQNSSDLIKYQWQKDRASNRISENLQTFWSNSLKLQGKQYLYELE